MFFYVSKIAWFIIQPLGLVLLLLGLTLLAVIAGWRRLSIILPLLAFVILGVSSLSNLGQLILTPLEERFVRPEQAPAAIAGIIVLGGGLAGAVNEARGGYEMEAAGDRFLEGAVLARRYPDMPLLISGGSGELIASGEGDAITAVRLFGALGIPQDRLILESASRNTDENARFTANLLGERAKQPWLLVTSAFHMPRAMALFRKAGVNVIPWPTDYRSPGQTRLRFGGRSAISALDELTLAMREWTGLTAYWLTGRIDQLFPSP